MLYDGQIIDGRNRYRACLEAGVEPRFEEWNGEGDLVKFVVSLNLHRRHLDESQRAMVAGRVANMEVGRPENNCSNLSNISQSQAAELVNVARTSLQSAVKVLDHGTKQLVKAVDDGLIPVSRAAHLVSASPELQRAVVQKVKAGAKPIACFTKPPTLEGYQQLVQALEQLIPYDLRAGCPSLVSFGLPRASHVGRHRVPLRLSLVGLLKE